MSGVCRKPRMMGCLVCVFFGSDAWIQNNNFVEHIYIYILYTYIYILNDEMEMMMYLYFLWNCLKTMDSGFFLRLILLIDGIGQNLSFRHHVKQIYYIHIYIYTQTHSMISKYELISLNKIRKKHKKKKMLWKWWLWILKMVIGRDECRAIYMHIARCSKQCVLEFSGYSPTRFTTLVIFI